MRLWTLHPSTLDTKGFVGLWRECCVAVTALRNKGGYFHHSQLDRFKATNNPLEYIGKYMEIVFDESINRGYKFNKNLIPYNDVELYSIPVTNGQMIFEYHHLANKLLKRDHNKYNELMKRMEIHPLFHVINGPKENWEK